MRCKGAFKVYKTAARVLLSRSELVLFPVLSLCICTSRAVGYRLRNGLLAAAECP